MWKRRNQYATIEEYLTARSGCSLAELENPTPVPASSIQGLQQAARLIYEFSQVEDAQIVIVGDYDVDGITSSAMLTMLLNYLWVTPKTIIPRRFTDGYGINESMIAGVKDSLIITVDNGITAYDVVEQAKENGNRFIILDHHLPTDVLPEPDVLVDPHVQPEENGFVDYCAAGLVMKLVNEGAGEEAHRLMVNLRVLACLGTIADVMPLVGDNRRMVINGINLINSQDYHYLNAGIRAILRIQEERCDEETIKFKTAPILNAPGRLHDSGSRSTLKAVLCKDENLAASYAEKMFTINEKRKSLVKEWAARAEADLGEDFSESAIILCYEDLPEGLAGIIAGRLSKEYHRVAFVFTATKEPGILKASGRTYGDYDISGLLNDVKDKAVKAGGHAGAAGISIEKSRFEGIKAQMLAYMDKNWVEQDNALYYDCEIDEKQVVEALETLKRYAPFGEGIERPVFHVKSFHAIPKKGTSHFMLMGQTKAHIRLTGQYVDAVGFNLAETYDGLGNPNVVDLIAEVTENVYKGKASPQLNIIDVGEPTEY